MVSASERLGYAWTATKRHLLSEIVRAAIAGGLFYGLLRSGAQNSTEASKALIEAIGPVIASGIVALSFFVGEFTLNLVRAGDKIALERERAAHERTRRGQSGESPVENGVRDLSTDELMKLRRGRTVLESNPLVKPHLGKHLTLNATVYDVTAGLLSSRLVVDGGQDRLLVFCQFGPFRRKELEMLRHGDAVAVSGDLSEVAQYTVTLKNCEFTRVLATQAIPEETAPHTTE